MKLYLITLITIQSFMAFAQNTTLYTTTLDTDNKTVIFNGIVNYQTLVKDSTCNWLTKDATNFKANEKAIATINAATNIHYVVFGGTWCGDTKAQLPKFFATMQQANISQTKITMLGVDRTKNTIGNLAKAFCVTNVPTFIILKAGTEIGRIIEYGTTNGKVDEEIAAIIEKN